MNLHIAKLPKLISQRRSSAIFGVVIIVMLWSGLAIKYFDSVQTDQHEAERSNQNFAMVFEENVLRSIGEIDKALLYLRRAIETRAGTTDFHTIVNTTDILSEIIVQVGIIDTAGMMRASNVGPQPPPLIDLSDREHYRIHLNSSEDKLFISKPVIGRASGQWSVQVARRFLDRNGNFGGVVVASLNPNHLTQFYDKIDFGQAASIALIGNDAVVRSSGGTAGGYLLGQELTGTKLFEHIRASTNATFEDVAPSGSERRLVTVRKVRDQPLWVAVSIDKSEIFRNSRATLQLGTIACIVLTLAMLAAMELIFLSEDRASQKAKQLGFTLEHMGQGIMLVTKDLQIPLINRNCAELLGFPAEFINPPPTYDRLLAYHGDASAGRESPLAAVPSPLNITEAAPVSTQTSACERRMPNGAVIEVRSGHLPDGSFVHTITDITKRCEAEANIARMASEDPLTGLPNRRVFGASLDQVIEQRRPADEDSTRMKDFGVLFLDLDRFKVINDTLGHRTGDLLLQEVAQRLKGTLRSADILSRLGGDEFAIIVPEVESRSDLEALANRLSDAFSDPFELDGHTVRSNVSVGIAVGPADGECGDDLLMAADLALYAVKASGGRGFQFYQKKMNQQINERRQIENDLREALDRNELELHYQPIFDLKSNTVSGFEALARWRHPVKGMVPPMTFIPVAEDSGLIGPLGEWALAAACHQAAKWPAGMKVAVNLSPIQFSSPNLVDRVACILAESGLSPKCLEFEITERVFMDDSEHTLSTLHQLKKIGVRIALDDFGTGYSSLSYLRRFPFDKIKIDRSFVSDLSQRTEHAPIIQAVVNIAAALGMETTAEGIETKDQHEFLTALGCNEGQGYYLGKPMPIESHADIISERAIKEILAA